MIDVSEPTMSNVVAPAATAAICAACPDPIRNGNSGISAPIENITKEETAAAHGEPNPPSGQADVAYQAVVDPEHGRPQRAASSARAALLRLVGQHGPLVRTHRLLLRPEQPADHDDPPPCSRRNRSTSAARASPDGRFPS